MLAMTDTSLPLDGGGVRVGVISFTDITPLNYLYNVVQLLRQIISVTVH